MFRILRLMTVVILAGSPIAQAEHPLDPLSWQEHWQILEVLQKNGRLDFTTQISQIRLIEPDKAKVWAWEPGQKLARGAFVVLRHAGNAHEIDIDLSKSIITRDDLVEARNVSWSSNEFFIGMEAALSHPAFIEGLAKRGFDDPTFLNCFTIPPGYFGTEEEQGLRIGHLRCQSAKGVRNPWPRQIEGLTAVIDMNQGTVIKVVDEFDGGLHDTTADYDLESVAPLRDMPPPLMVRQGTRPGYLHVGHQVWWQKWSFHARVDQREGLVISTVRYGDDEARPVLYQGYLSEIFVPYMDPGFAWHARNFIDAGEFIGLGLYQPLLPGKDCPREATYQDALNTDATGRPRVIANVLCIFERDSGDPAWRHFEANISDSRPSRDLIVRVAAVIGNYDYLIDWVFQQNGSIVVRLGATGIVESKMSSAANATEQNKKRPADAYGHFVDQHIVGVNHSHYFNFRLDLDVDGQENAFAKDRLVTQSLDDNRRKSVWVQSQEVLEREQSAMLNKNYSMPALWRVLSTTRKNHVGYPTSYQLRPGATAETLLLPEDYPRKRAGFIDHHLWVTPYSARERYAAGEYPTLSEPGEGLPQWTRTNRSIDRTDLVLWYTMGMHHLVRAEDWPVMPVLWHEFELRPFDFFDRNPALDLPPER